MLALQSTDCGCQYRRGNVQNARVLEFAPGDDLATIILDNSACIIPYNHE
jgi:hypothetical protein